MTIKITERMVPLVRLGTMAGMRVPLAEAVGRRRGARSLSTYWLRIGVMDPRAGDPDAEPRR